MGERRGSRRQKSLLRGFVYLSRRRLPVGCLIRDFSEKGARIIFADPVTLPDVVDLYIPQKKETLRARVQWRRDGEIGVGFVATERTPPAEPSASEVAQRIALLEAEIASLRELLERRKRDKRREDEEAAA